MRCGCVTFLTGAALQVRRGTVLAADARPPVLLKQLVHALDDALQRLVHVQPDLLLKGHEPTQTHTEEHTQLPAG